MDPFSSYVLRASPACPFNHTFALVFKQATADALFHRLPILTTATRVDATIATRNGSRMPFMYAFRTSSISPEESTGAQVRRTGLHHLPSVDARGLGWDGRKKNIVARRFAGGDEYKPPRVCTAAKTQI